MVVQGKIGRPARVAAFVVCSIVSIFVLIPIVMIVYNSLRTNGELLLTPFGLPADGFHWENYGRILASNSGFWENLLNSVLATIGTVILLLAKPRRSPFVFRTRSSARFTS